MDLLRGEFEKMKKELIHLGEDADELSFWENFFDLMPSEQKFELLASLKTELEELKKI